MNFFEQQAKARRRSGVLVFWMAVAVLAIVLAINAGGFAISVWAGFVEPRLDAWFASSIFKFCTLAPLVVMTINFLVRWFELRSGGDAVAQMLRARPIETSSSDFKEQQLVNVVEEMAIASGTPPPTLWLLEDEQGINAMVAGYRPGEAAMIVTRGTLETLNREELQGVVGHEFSHILNGDMRLNVKLVAILSGILAIGVAGKQLIGMMFRGATGGYHGRRRWSSSRGSDSDGGGAIGLLVVAVGAGLGLIAVGYVGTLAGRMIKASVSRQREFLADASAVQFTRSSDGIAGALAKIRDHVEGSHVNEPHIEETAHMLFGDGLGLSGMFATHPPLEDRIKAIDPRFLIQRAAVAEREAREVEVSEQRASVAGAGAGIVGLGASAGLAGAAIGGALSADALSAGADWTGAAPGAPAVAGLEAVGLVAMAGTHSQAHVDHARDMLARWPRPLLEAAHHPRNASHVVYALLVGAMRPAYRAAAMAELAEREGGSAERMVEALLLNVIELQDESRLPLLEICLPALRRSHQVHRDRLIATAALLVAADQRQTVFEFAMLTLLEHHLGGEAGREEPARQSSMTPVMKEVRALLTAMARAGADDAHEAKAAFAAAARMLGTPDLQPTATRLDTLPSQLAKLAGLSYLLKQPLLEACAAAVMADGEIKVAEAELLRAVAASLDCPMPPILAAA